MNGGREMEELKAQDTYLASFGDLLLEAQARYTAADWKREKGSTKPYIKSQLLSN